VVVVVAGSVVDVDVDVVAVVLDARAGRVVVVLASRAVA
jgi:hypothetical protein